MYEIPYEEFCRNVDENVDHQTKRAMNMAILAALIAAVGIFFLISAMNRWDMGKNTDLAKGNYSILSADDVFSDNNISFSVKNYHISEKQVSVVVNVVNESSKSFSMTTDDFDIYCFDPGCSRRCIISNIDVIPVPAMSDTEIVLTVSPPEDFIISDDMYISVYAAIPNSNSRCEFLLK